MAIPIENMLGYLCTRPSRTKEDEVEFYVEQGIVIKPGPLPIVSKPPTCVGILYSVDGKVELRHPEE